MVFGLPEKKIRLIETLLVENAHYALNMIYDTGWKAFFVVPRVEKAILS